MYAVIAFQWSSDKWVTALVVVLRFVLFCVLLENNLVIQNHGEASVQITLIKHQQNIAFIGKNGGKSEILCHGRGSKSTASHF